jgi:uncharacterized protein
VTGADPTVLQDTERHRYAISVDGEQAGFTAYEPHGDLIAFMHTEIDPRFEGQGLGSRLIGQALDDVREQGRSVLPFCPFVRSFIASHGEYTDLVPEQRREAFGLTP